MRAARKPRAVTAFDAVAVDVGALPAFRDYRLEQLGSGRCRYACSGVNGPHRFCGRPTTISRTNKHGSWCCEHFAVVFVAWRRGGTAAPTAEGGLSR